MNLLQTCWVFDLCSLYAMDNDFNRYRRVFQYLLRLKRTQMELEKSWASVMHQEHRNFAKRRNDRDKYSTTQLGHQQFCAMWHVREHMAFLIRNLQFYIQVVIYVEFMRLPLSILFNPLLIIHLLVQYLSSLIYLFFKSEIRSILYSKYHAFHCRWM